MSDQNPLIQLDQIGKVFFTDEIETHALQSISLRIHKGEYVSVSGPSGCGKSTLLSVLGLLDSPSSGQYQLNGQSVAGLSRDQRAKVRNREIGFIFQSFNLISDLSVAENIALPLTYRTDLDKKHIQPLVDKALARVEMSHRRNHFPSQLSGGQQQRVAIARAIAGSPSLILADEPTGNLDSHNAQLVMDLLNSLHQDGATICMVTHDPRSARHAKRVIELFDGQLVADSAHQSSAEVVYAAV